MKNGMSSMGWWSLAAALVCAVGCGKEDCTNTLASTCGPQFKAKADFYKANDECKADGKQDLRVPEAARKAQDSALVACGNSLGKGGGGS